MKDIPEDANNLLSSTLHEIRKGTVNSRFPPVPPVTIRGRIVGNRFLQLGYLTLMPWIGIPGTQRRCKLAELLEDYQMSILGTVDES